MEFSWAIFLAGLLLGIFQLAVGVAIGRVLPTARKDPPPPSPDTHEIQQVRKFTNRLYRLVTSVASDVGHHQVRLEQVTQELTAIQNSKANQVADYVLERVARIVELNHQLHDRLCAAETQLEEQADQLETRMVEARTDPLTGLANRRAFDDELKRRLDEWCARQLAFCLLIFDTDQFKTLNDRFGHLAGDEALQSIAHSAGESLDEMDLIARLGGDEFAAILPRTDLEEAKRVSEQLRARVAANRLTFGEETFQPTISLGLAPVLKDDDAMTLLKRADTALYASKRAGRNRGYFNDGRRCEPIVPDANASDEEAPAAEEKKPRDPDLDVLCANLRQRLDEVADEEIQEAVRE